MKDLTRLDRSPRLLACTVAAWAAVVVVLRVWFAVAYQTNWGGDPEIPDAFGTRPESR